MVVSKSITNVVRILIIAVIAVIADYDNSCNDNNA